MAKHSIKKIYDNDIYHLPLISLVLYLCTYSYEYIPNKYVGIPSGVVSIGITDIVGDVFQMVLYLAPIIIIYGISFLFNINKLAIFTIVSLSSLILCAIACYKRDVDMYGPLTSLFLLIASSAMVKIRADGNYVFDFLNVDFKEQFIPDIGIIFAFLLSLFAVSGYIGMLKITETEKKEVYFDNVKYFILRNYQNDIFLVKKDNSNGEVLWLRKDSGNIIYLNKL